MKELDINVLAIVGGGVGPYLMASILAPTLKQLGVHLVLVDEDETIEPPSVTTIGHEYKALCDILGVGGAALLDEAAGRVCLGVSCEVVDRSWIVPYGDYGLRAADQGFTASLLKVLSEDNSLDVADYSLTANAMLLESVDVDDCIRLAIDYGVQLDTSLFKECLKRLLSGHNVEIVKSASKGLVRDRGGVVAGVELEAGVTLKADFWIDASSSCCKNSPSVGSDLAALPWDSVVSFNKPLSPSGSGSSVEISFLDWAWLRVSYSKKSTCYEVFYCSKSMSFADVKSRLTSLNMLDDEVLELSEAYNRLFESPWRGNCLSVGGSGRGVITEGSYSLLQSMSVLFLDLFPVTGGKLEAEHFNRAWADHQRESVDYLQLMMTPALGGKFVSESLRQRMDVFSRRGMILPFESDAHQSSQWLGMLCGVGLRPKESSLIMADAPVARLEAGLKAVRQVMLSRLNSQE